jgi:hypothetical protein
MKKFTVILGTIYFVLIILSGCGLGKKSEKINLNNITEIDNYLQGTWEKSKAGSSPGSVTFKANITFNKGNVTIGIIVMEGGSMKEYNGTYTIGDIQFLKFDSDGKTPLQFRDIKLNLYNIDDITRDYIKEMYFTYGNTSAGFYDLAASGIDGFPLNKISDLPDSDEYSTSSNNSKSTSTNENQNNNNSSNTIDQIETPIPPPEEIIESNNMPVSDAENEDLVINQTIRFVESYYDAITNKDFDATKWFEKMVTNYISKTNISPEEINQLQTNNNEFLDQKSNIDESTFKLVREENGISYWQFWHNFICYRASKGKYQTCNVLTEIGINSSTNKINSYRELKISDLKFTIEKPQ